jgi:hypothetical protein
VNEGIKRRTRVVCVFPNDAAITRLVGAVLLEQQHEHWQLGGRRIFSAESMAAIPDLESHSPPCRSPSPEKSTRRPQVVEIAAPPQGAAASIAAWRPVLELPGLHRRILPLSTHPQFDERLDQSFYPIHRGSKRRTCASGMQASHSTMFTL